MKIIAGILVSLVVFCTMFVAKDFSAGIYEFVSDVNDVFVVEGIDADEFIDVPLICQYPELSTGCESVATTMVLQYYGEDISAQDFASNWLECGDFYSSDGMGFGPDPNKVFAGNPFSEYSYGCFSGPIANAVNQNSSICNAEIITDKSLEELCKKYIDNNEPVLIWATMYMKESYEGNSWYLEDDSVFTWTAQEHCLVLVGYNDDCYFLNDPMTGSTVSYEKELVEQRFAELGNQAILITPDEV